MTDSGYANYLSSIKIFTRVPVFYCNLCDLFSKILPPDLLQNHLNSAAYILPENEQTYYQKKIGFFNFITSLILRYKNHPRILDVGCSYGHLMMAAAEQGIDADGVEINDSFRERLKTKGFRVYKDLFEVSHRYDAITFIDSFFYFQNPLDVLRRCKDLLKEDGILLLRLTNRNWLARLRWTLFKRSDLSVLGDTTHSYSIKSISRSLNQTGFRIKDIHLFEKGRMKKIFHLLAYLLAIATFKQFVLTSGLIVVACREA
ncbi:MAG: class I SAM-dependent methyltransferase [Nitrospirae bacterium]|nr:class I SAM-dependent methyltransferase [Nitrospirota bacterium]